MPVTDARQRGVRRSFRAVGNFHLPPACLNGQSKSSCSNSGDAWQQSDHHAASHSYAQLISSTDLYPAPD